jgi:hypothetical protein
MDRTLLVFPALMLSFAQAIAQEWQQFGIEKFGFVFDVPSEFDLLHRSEDGDGAAFHAPDGALLAVWGTNVAKGNFLSEVKKQISRDEKEGWKFTYRRLTRAWASYSGIKGDQIRYVRGITVCRDRAAMFLIDYSRDQKVAYDPVVTRMVRSLKSEGC